jgi:hypothetical protein
VDTYRDPGYHRFAHYHRGSYRQLSKEQGQVDDTNLLLLPLIVEVPNRKGAPRRYPDHPTADKLITHMAFSRVYVTRTAHHAAHVPWYHTLDMMGYIRPSSFLPPALNLCYFQMPYVWTFILSLNSGE